jgi:hypothetical protein
MRRIVFAQPGISIRGFHALALLSIVLAMTCFSEPAAAQATYSYTGHPFTLFSCGPFIDNGTVTGTSTCSTPAPTNQYTSYTATDHVTGTLALAAPLPANMAITDVRTFAGFQLSMNDGEHTVTDLDQQGMFAEVATDASGNISQWRLVINTGGALNGGIATVKKDTSVFDQGVLACCDPGVSGNLAFVFSNPGTWNSGSPTPTPAQAVTNLISMLSNPLLGLTPGQISSLTDKLNNVLASIQAGQTKQAINQLNSFINSVQSSLKNGKITPQAANTLTSTANNIIAMLSS